MNAPSEFIIAEMERLWRAGYSKSEIQVELAKNGVRWTMDHERAFNKFGIGSGR